MNKLDTEILYHKSEKLEKIMFQVRLNPKTQGSVNLQNQDREIKKKKKAQWVNKE